MNSLILKYKSISFISFKVWAWGGEDYIESNLNLSRPFPWLEMLKLYRSMQMVLNSSAIEDLDEVCHQIVKENQCSMFCFFHMKQSVLFKSQNTWQYLGQ